MKKNDRDISLSKSETEVKQNLYSETFKTTNVNILLNRVRLDQKRTLKKRIVFSIVLAGLVSTVAVYFII